LPFFWQFWYASIFPSMLGHHGSQICGSPWFRSSDGVAPLQQTLSHARLEEDLVPTLPTGCELVADDPHRQGQKQDADEGENGRHDVAQQRFGIVVTITWETMAHGMLRAC